MTKIRNIVIGFSLSNFYSIGNVLAINSRTHQMFLHLPIHNANTNYYVYSNGTCPCPTPSSPLWSKSHSVILCGWMDGWLAMKASIQMQYKTNKQSIHARSSMIFSNDKNQHYLFSHHQRRNA